MPIRAENRGRYPANWPQVSVEIRTVRAAGRCECTGQCGHNHGGRCAARNGQPHPVTGSKVVLTVAHLDHTPENCDPANLLAACQRCHLSYDADHHAANRARTLHAQRTEGMDPLFTTDCAGSSEAPTGSPAHAPAPASPSGAGAPIDPSRPFFKVTVVGTPAPQGSKRHVGRGVMIESSKKVKPWREAVKTAALDFVTDAEQYGRFKDPFPLDGPLLVEMCFTLARPKSAPKSRTHPDRTPDLSKLIRSTEDALTDAGVWADDARVVRYRDPRKVYPHPFSSDPDALAMPGAVIRVWQVTA